MLIGSLEIFFNEKLNKNAAIFFPENTFKVLSAKCFSLNVLILPEKANIPFKLNTVLII